MVNETIHLNGETKTYASVKPQVNNMSNLPQSEPKMDAAAEVPRKKSISEAGIMNTVDNVQTLTDMLSLYVGYAPSNPLLTTTHIVGMIGYGLEIMEYVGY